MKHWSSKPLSVVSIAFACLVLAVSGVELAGQNPPGGAAPQGPAGAPGAGPGAGPQGPGQGRGAGRGQGRGRGGGRGPAANALGDGPFDIDTEKGKVRLTVVTKGLDHPWGLAFLPDGGMLVTERPGRLRVIRNGVLDPTPIAGVPEVRAAVLGGLLDIALHPQFAKNRLLYLSYSKAGAENPANATTAVARARWDGGATLTDVTDVLVADAHYGAQPLPGRCCGQGPPDGSYGSRLVFDRAGFLYITIGDRNYGEMSQNPATHIGKILRLRDDGTVPPDNPFVGREGHKPEIYTLGHRNPLGLTIHPTTGEIWSTEFGPRGGDELNRIQAGRNYGWILVTEGQHYNNEPAARGQNAVPGMEDPVLFWAPSINPGNLIFYDGDRFPQWKGDMLMAAMSRSVLRASFDAQGKPASQERMFTELKQRFRDVRQGPDGFIYLLTDETAGAVLRLEPAP
jgi:glucose/arabinose dehydrogenase